MEYCAMNKYDHMQAHKVIQHKVIHLPGQERCKIIIPKVRVLLHFCETTKILEEYKMRKDIVHSQQRVWGAETHHTPLKHPHAFTHGLRPHRVPSDSVVLGPLPCGSSCVFTAYPVLCAWVEHFYITAVVL